MYKRKIMDEFVAWKNDTGKKKALVIKGMRQIGKTYIVQAFAKAVCSSSVSTLRAGEVSSLFIFIKFFHLFLPFKRFFLVHNWRYRIFTFVKGRKPRSKNFKMFVNKCFSVFVQSFIIF